MGRFPLLLLLLRLAECAQASSIGGIVSDSVTGRPLAGFTVSTYVNATFVGDVLLKSSATREPSAVTDEQGRYRLADLPPGAYRVTARDSRRGAVGVTRHIQLAGRDLDNIDFSISLPGMITGRVIDETGHPMPHAQVYLVSPEYRFGALGQFVNGVATTDDRGAYTHSMVEAGRPWLLMADRTYYPNSTDPQSAVAILLRPTETRDHVDIEVRKAATYCVEGAAPHGLTIAIDPPQPSGGAPRGLETTAGEEGKFRLCGFSPGAYVLSAVDNPRRPANRALLPIDIVDHDVSANVAVGPGIPLNFDVVWDGAAPENAPAVQVRLSLTPLIGARNLAGPGSATVDVPGVVTLPSVLPSEYGLRAFVGVPGIYVKDVLYAGSSVLYSPLRLGGAGASGARVIVGRDGATLTARVQDKDGNPLPDLQVLAIPAEVSSEAMLAAALVRGHSDQAGQYRSPSLAPGKYLVFATEDRVDASPQSIAALWRARARFQEVTLPPNGAAQATLTSLRLE